MCIFVGVRPCFSINCLFCYGEADGLAVDLDTLKFDARAVFFRPVPRAMARMAFLSTKKIDERVSPMLHLIYLLVFHLARKL